MSQTTAGLPVANHAESTENAAYVCSIEQQMQKGHNPFCFVYKQLLKLPITLRWSKSQKYT